MLSFEHDLAAAHRLAGFGSEVEVLSPPPVREQLRATAYGILDRHRTDWPPGKEEASSETEFPARPPSCKPEPCPTPEQSRYPENGGYITGKSAYASRMTDPGGHQLRIGREDGSAPAQQSRCVTIAGRSRRARSGVLLGNGVGDVAACARPKGRLVPSAERAGPGGLGWLQLVDANEVEIAERRP